MRANDVLKVTSNILATRTLEWKANIENTGLSKANFEATTIVTQDFLQRNCVKDKKNCITDLPSERYKFRAIADGYKLTGR